MIGRAPDPTYPRLRQAVGLLVALIALQMLLFVLAALLDLALGLDLEGDPLMLSVVLVSAFAVIVVRGWKRTGMPWGSVFPLGPFPVALLLPMALVTVGGSVMLSEIGNLISIVLPAPESLSEFFEGLTSEEAGVLASSLALVIVAPLTEELLFRGLILRGLLQHYSARRAVVISALLFGLFHLNPWQFATASVIGLLLGWLTLATGTLWPAILVHAANNALASWAPALPEIPGYSTGFTDEVTLQPLWFDAAGLAVLAGGLWLLWRALGATAALTPPADGLTPSAEPQDA